MKISPTTEIKTEPWVSGSGVGPTDAGAAPGGPGWWREGGVAALPDPTRPGPTLLRTALVILLLFTVSWHDPSFTKSAYLNIPKTIIQYIHI